jgi:hypothetical protein
MEEVITQAMEAAPTNQAMAANSIP